MSIQESVDKKCAYSTVQEVCKQWNAVYSIVVHVQYGQMCHATFTHIGLHHELLLTKRRSSHGNRQHDKQ